MPPLSRHLKQHGLLYQRTPPASSPQKRAGGLLLFLRTMAMSPSPKHANASWRWIDVLQDPPSHLSATLAEGGLTRASPPPLPARASWRWVSFLLDRHDHTPSSPSSALHPLQHTAFPLHVPCTPNAHISQRWIPFIDVYSPRPHLPLTQERAGGGFISTGMGTSTGGLNFTRK